MLSGQNACVGANVSLSQRTAGRIHHPSGRLCAVFFSCPSQLRPRAAATHRAQARRGSVAGTAMVDGQIIQFSEVGNASGGGRRPPNPAWPGGLLDIRLGNCNQPPVLNMSIYDGNPSPGRYEVPSSQLGSQTEGATASLQYPTEAWNAGGFYRGSSGSIAVSSISSTRVSGSFSFTLVQRALPTGGIVGVLPPPPTKLIEGTFDLVISDRRICP